MKRKELLKQFSKDISNEELEITRKVLRIMLDVYMTAPVWDISIITLLEDTLDNIPTDWDKFLKNLGG